METPYALLYYVALIDTVTGAVLTIGTYPTAMYFLEECIPDTWVAGSINSPNHMGRFFPMPFFLAAEDPARYPYWTWDHASRRLMKTKKELIDERLLERSRLAEGKRDIITKIMNSLSSTRRKMATGVGFQDIVYAEKIANARAFKALGYDEDRIMEFPYVLQYADFAQISFQQAADDIILKRTFDNDVLLKTELIRLKYFNRVRNARSVEEFPSLYEEFLKDTYRNALI